MEKERHNYVCYGKNSAYKSAISVKLTFKISSYNKVIISSGQSGETKKNNVSGSICNY